MEDLNAAAALRNDTLGTWQAALAAAAAAMVVSSLAAAHPGTRFMTVRFGTVLGSSGSVIPKLK